MKTDEQIIETILTLVKATNIARDQERYADCILIYSQLIDVFVEAESKEILPLDTLVKFKIDLYKDLGSSQYLTGEFDDAIKSYQYCLSLYEERTWGDLVKLVIGITDTKVKLAKIFVQKNSLNEASKFLQESLDDYKIIENDLDCSSKKIEINMELASLNKKNKELEKALYFYNAALNEYDCISGNVSPELNCLKASLFANMASVLVLQGVSNKAITLYKKALRFYNEGACTNNSNYHTDRGNAYSFLVTLLGSVGELDEAIKVCFQALTVYKKIVVEGHTELIIQIADILSKFSELLSLTDNQDQSIDDYQRVLTLLEELPSEEKLDYAIADINLDLASLLDQKGLLDDAIDAAGLSIAICEDEKYSGYLKFEKILISSYSNLGVFISKKGYDDDAIDVYQYVLKLYEKIMPPIPSDLAKSQYQVQMNLGISLASNNRLDEAIEAYHSALSFHENNFDTSDPKHLQTHSTLMSNYAVALKNNNELDKALVINKKIITSYNEAEIKNNPKINYKLFLLNMNIGNIYAEKEDFKQAISFYQDGIILLEQDENSFMLPLQENLFRAYRNVSKIMCQMPKSTEWARKKSSKMVQMLELVSESGLGGSSEKYWLAMRNLFEEFQTNWLTSTIKSGSTYIIPEIVSIIQGREITKEIIDKLSRIESLEDQPIILQNYQLIREKLRNMISSYYSHSYASDDTSSSKREFPIEEYNKLQHELITSRKKASTVPGFENLHPNASEFCLEALQANHLFTELQCLMMLIKIGGISGVLLVNKTGRPIWLSVNDLPVLGKALQSVDRFSNSCDAYRKFPQREVIRNSSESQSTLSNVFIESEYQTFWPDFIKLMKEEFWKVISKRLLKNINELIILPQGDFHQLPLDAGKPEGLSLIYYPGLIFYGTATGLIKQAELPKKADKLELGLLHYSAKGYKRHYLPGVDREVNKILSLYPNTSIRCLDAPKDFPCGSLNISRLHFAGHGGIDPKDKNSTALWVNGKLNDRSSKKITTNFIGSYDVLIGESQVEHAYIGACTIGRIHENSQGTPLGLITGFFRKGTQSVTAPLFSIDDELAEIFGVLWEEYSIKSNESNFKPRKQLAEVQSIFKRKFLRTHIRKALTKSHENGCFRKYIQEELYTSYILENKTISEIDALCLMDLDYSALADKIIEVMDVQGYIIKNNTNITPELGTFLFAMRVYGG